MDTSVDAAFGEIVAGPRQLPMPTADGPKGAGNPEGQRYLTDAMRVLRARHVEFSHQAHHDLLAVRELSSRRCSRLLLQYRRGAACYGSTVITPALD